MSELEKPERVEVGQRWHSKGHGGTFVVTDVSADRMKMRWESGCHAALGHDDGVGLAFVSHADVTYLGGPTPPVSPVGPTSEPVGTVKSINPDGSFEVQFGTPPTAPSVPHREVKLNLEWHHSPSELDRAVERLSALAKKNVASPKTAPAAQHGGVFYPRCKWNEPKQEYPGALVYCTGCNNPVAHPASPFCESHISQAMDERDRVKREARKESPFQQSHLLGQGAIGIWSLRSEDGK